MEFRPSADRSGSLRLPRSRPSFPAGETTRKKTNSKPLIDFLALIDGVVDNVLDELGATFVIELSAADHNGTDSVVVKPLHVVIDVRLHKTRTGIKQEST